MRILIDADACPDLSLIAQLAIRYQVVAIAFFDTAHQIKIEGMIAHQVDCSSQSVDVALWTEMQKGDLVITSDYGLAAMCLTKGLVLHPKGFIYTREEIDRLLYSRYLASKFRRAGGRLKGPAPRTKFQTRQLLEKLEELLKNQ